ncbi:MAG: LPS export ABC transporter permease LptF [Deferribacteres bacterium]|nr:LPS export ABC transporter permease LptF [Deferribacteres bacterium]
MIIHRSILKELSRNFIVIILSLSVLLFMEKFLRLSRLLMGKGADFTDIVKVFWYLQPSILLLSVPMAILIAAFLTYGRMAADSEIVVLKGSGMSFPSISRPAITLSAACFFILLFMSLYLLPRSMQSFKHTLQEAILKKASMTFEEGTFSDVFKGSVIFVKEIPSDNVFRGIFVYRDAESAGDEPAVIVARNGTIVSNPQEGLIKLTMYDGLIHTFKDNTSSEITFSEYDFVLSTGMESTGKTKADEVKTTDLWKGRKGVLLWDIELNRRFALPFACLIFGILAPALANKVGKIGRLGGFSLSVALLILYYILLIMGETFAKSGRLSPFLGEWLPNMFFGIVAGVFFYIACKDRPIGRF